MSWNWFNDLPTVLTSIRGHIKSLLKKHSEVGTQIVLKITELRWIFFIAPLVFCLFLQDHLLILTEITESAIPEMNEINPIIRSEKRFDVIITFN